MSDISRQRSLGVADMTLFTVSAILILDTVAASAAIGVASITWWFILGIFFLIPYSMINAEMATAYPEQGGIYAWVRDAFGARWGTRVTWLYWVNVVLWGASVYVLFAGVFAQIFLPDLSLTLRLALAIAVNWLVVLVCCAPLRFSKWVPNLGAALKLITFLALVVAGVVYLAGAEGLANDMSPAAFIPEWGSSMQYLSIIIYCMVGFELVAAASEELKNPTKDMPRAIFWSAGITFSAMVLGTLAVLLAIPAEDVDLVEGLVDTFRQLFGDSPAGDAAAVMFGIFALVTFATNVATWMLGVNRATAESARDGELPGVLGWENPNNGAPIGANLVMGALVTVILLAYGLLADTNEDLFWQLLAASIVLFLLPYAGLVAAFYRARIMDAARPRPYRVPGGMAIAGCFTLLCIGAIAICLGFLMYVPDAGPDWSVIGGTVAAIVLGEFAIAWSEWRKGNNRADG